MKKLVKLGALMAFLVLTALTSMQAQKFGYLNSSAILSEMPEVRQMQSNLEGLQKQLQNKGQQMVTDYQQKEKSATDRKAAGTMTPKEEETVIMELQTKQQEILKFEQDMMTKLQEKEQALLAPILEKVNNAIQAVSKEGGYQFVFDTTSGALLYADETADISAKVKAKLGL